MQLGRVGNVRKHTVENHFNMAAWNSQIQANVCVFISPSYIFVSDLQTVYHNQLHLFDFIVL